MNLLILINAAENYRPLFRNLGLELESRGHRVFYAVDSHVSDYLYPHAPLPADRTFYFSDYFEANYATAELPPEFAEIDLGVALFPDMDRARTWGEKLDRPDDFYDRLTANLASFFLKIVRENAIDVTTYESVSNSLAYFAYHATRAAGRQFLGFNMSRVPGRFDIAETSTCGMNIDLPVLYHRLLAGTARPDPETQKLADAYLKEADEVQPDYMSVQYTKPKTERQLFDHYVTKHKRLLQHRKEHPTEWTYAYQWPQRYYETALRTAAKEQLRARVKAPMLQKMYEQPKDGEEFFLYPIQYHPESSTSVDGYPHIDEWTNIVGLSAAMPRGVKMYVKEHIVAEGRQSMRFYRDVQQLPNVRLIDARVNARALLRRSLGVTLCTSTMGFEAIIRNKPVFVLGRPFYSFHPLVTPIGDLADAPALLRKNRDKRVSREDIRAFVTAYFMTTFPGVFAPGWNAENKELLREMSNVLELKRGPLASHIGRDRTLPIELPPLATMS